MATVAHPRLADQEYLMLQASADWPAPIELIAGEAVVMAPPGQRAMTVQRELFYVMRGWQERSGDAGLLLMDTFVHMPSGSYLAPDIAWWRVSRRRPPTGGAVEGVPDLVVEVLSPGTRASDLGPKRELYLADGASELWLVDPEARTIVVASPAGESAPLGPGDRLSSSLLPGFAVDLARIFAS